MSQCYYVTSIVKSYTIGNHFRLTIQINISRGMLILISVRRNRLVLSAPANMRSFWVRTLSSNVFMTYVDEVFICWTTKREKQTYPLEKKSRLSFENSSLFYLTCLQRVNPLIHGSHLIFIMVLKCFIELSVIQCSIFLQKYILTKIAADIFTALFLFAIHARAPHPYLFY